MKALIENEMRRLTSESGVCELGGYRVLRCSGNDAKRFLNGQLSQNVLTLDDGVGLRACLLTAKGKLVGVPICWRAQGDFYLEVPAEQLESVLARLERYVVADDVTFSDVTERCFGLHLIGPSVQSDTSRVIYRNQFKRFGVEGTDVWFGSAADRNAFLKELFQGGVSELSGDDLEFLRIVSRLPKWGSELDEDVLPAEAGLDRIAVDFHKGCYMGQEVVSRMEMAGRVRRELVFWSTLALFNSLQEAKVFCEGVEMGKVTSWISTPGGSVGFAYLKSPVKMGARCEIRSAGDPIGSGIEIERK